MNRHRTDPRDEVLLDAPDYFVSTVFRGRGRYERRVAFSLAEARIAARELIRDRPAAIYAVRGGRQLHVENVERPHPARRIAQVGTDPRGR